MSYSDKNGYEQDYAKQMQRNMDKFHDECVDRMVREFEREEGRPATVAEIYMIAGEYYNN